MSTVHTVEDTFSIDSLEFTVNDPPFLPRYTKKINLQKGKEHLITDVSTFIDAAAFRDALSGTNDVNLFVTMVLSPYPAWEYINRRPSHVYHPVMPAGNNNVFYKRIMQITTSPDDGLTSFVWDEQYPAITLQDEDLRTFYTDHLYLSVFFFFTGVGVTRLVVDSFQASILVNMVEQEADPVSHAIGTIREFNDAQQLTNEMQSLELDAGAGYSGYWFPPWHYGGLRPEIMIQSDQVARWLGAEDYAEVMATRGGMQVVRNLASQMQPFDAAFGTPVGLGPEFPDWLRFLDNNPGVMARLRNEFPPMLKNTDGTTQML
jgi:hypothetical protein